MADQLPKRGEWSWLTSYKLSTSPLTCSLIALLQIHKNLEVKVSVAQISFLLANLTFCRHLAFHFPLLLIDNSSIHFLFKGIYSFSLLYSWFLLGFKEGTKINTSFQSTTFKQMPICDFGTCFLKEDSFQPKRAIQDREKISTTPKLANLDKLLSAPNSQLLLQ